jgi:general stress protein 26
MLSERARELIREVKIGYLATVEGDQPRVRAMSVYVNDEGRLIMATGKGTDKYRQAVANPKAELCFVSERWDQLRIEGWLKIIEDQAEKDRHWAAAPGLENYFESPSDPDYVLFELVPSRINMYEPEQG